VSDLDQSLTRLYETLAATGTQVFVGGSIAAMWYGEPRSTLDIDLVIRAGPADAERIAQAFPPEEYYVPPLEALQRELGRARDGQFNILDLQSGLKADVYVAGDDPLIAFGFQTATPRDLSGVTMNMASATYIVAMKLHYFGISSQEKHLRDIRSLLSVSPQEVDIERVAEWAKTFHLEATWRDCLARRGEE
jgi:hypothetical protein